MTRSEISTQNSHINFAVPDVRNLTALDAVDIPKEIHPGVIQQSIYLKSKSSRSMVVSFDGKKVASGLNEENADVDLFGLEKPYLIVTQKRLVNELCLIDRLQASLERYAILWDLADFYKSMITDEISVRHL
jgi:hypothetical protein